MRKTYALNDTNSRSKCRFWRFISYCEQLWRKCDKSGIGGRCSWFAHPPACGARFLMQQCNSRKRRLTSLLRLVRRRKFWVPVVRRCASLPVSIVDLCEVCSDTTIRWDWGYVGTADPGNFILAQALLKVSELRLPVSPTGRGRLRSPEPPSRASRPHNKPFTGAQAAWWSGHPHTPAGARR